MPRRTSSHPDLFAPKKDSPVPMEAVDRTKLLSLVSALLTEALAAVKVKGASDEDHA